MIDLEYLKLGHEVKDATDMANITCYQKRLESLAQQGRWYDVNQLIDEISEKYKTEANQYNKGRTPAKTPQERASACYQFLTSLFSEKTAKKLAEEAMKHLGGN